jgi:mevalonate kinase
MAVDFDVAAARSDKPIYYQLIDGEPKITKVDFKPLFKKNLYFVHLGKKQNTSSSVNEYRKKVKAETKVVDDISILSEVIRTATSLIDLTKHSNSTKKSYPVYWENPE